MSFGTAASRYTQPVTYGKDSGVPWQQEARHNKKKFNYKERSNKIPLRDRLKQAETERLLQEAEQEAKLRANKMLANRRRREAEVKAAQKLRQPNGILKPNKSGSKSDYVTLTQDQLSTILQTLSKAQGSADDIKLDVEDENHLKLILDKTDSSVPVSRESDQSLASNAQQLESVLNLSRKVKTSQDQKQSQSSVAHLRSDRQSLRSKGDSSRTRPRKQVVMNFNLNGESAGNKSKNAIKAKSSGKAKKQVTIADEDNYEDEEPVFVRRPAKVVVVDENPQSVEEPRADNTHELDGRQQSFPQETIPQQVIPPELSPRQKQLLIPRAHMTKAEKKRLQWELENAAIEKLQKENEERAIRLGMHLPGNKSEKSNTTDVVTKKRNKENSETVKAPTKIENVTLTREQMREAIVFVEPDFVPGLGDLSNREASRRPEVATDTVRTKEPSHDQPQRQTQAPSLSKAELKRLQWDKERAEAPAEYDPWGRPGVGVGPKAMAIVPPEQKEPAQKSYRKQDLTSQQQEQLYIKQQNSRRTASSQPETVEPASIPGLHPSTPSRVTDLRGPFQEPTTGVPTSMLGLENPAREMFRADAPVLQDTLTKAQLLRLKWAEDKAADIPEYNPFGKPGAGAPIRTDSGTVLTSYHSRQKHLMRKSVEEQQMRRSIEENQSRQTELNNRSANHTYNEKTAAQHTVPTLDLSNSHNGRQIENGLQIGEAEEMANRNHIRGQLVNLDAATLKEREEQRRRELRYQEDIRHQVEEKQRLKREDRLRKLKEEAEEEAKFRAERNNRQQEYEHTKELNKLKEAKEVSRVDLVAEAMQRAKQEAELFKARQRLEKLQNAGHDITHLKAAYEEKFSPRMGQTIGDMLTPRRDPGGAQSTLPNDILTSRTLNSQSRHQQKTVEPSSVPGLDLSPRGADTRQGHATARTAIDEGYTSRVLTPHKWQGTHKENRSPMKEFGVQTDTPTPGADKSSKQQKEKQHIIKKGTADNVKQQVRVISGPKSRKSKQPAEAKPWGWKNQVGKKFTGQSKRDPYYVEQQEQKSVRKQARQEQLLKQVEANSRHVPDGKNTRASVEIGNKDRDTVNSYLSPRYKINDPISPRDTSGLNTQNTYGRESNSSVALKTTESKHATSSKKQADNVKQSTAGYELSIADTLRITHDDEYIPFRRSDAVLSPSNAQEPSPMSREHTQAALAREAYHKSMQPAQYGVHMHNIRDANQPPLTSNRTTADPHKKDPLYNPLVLTKHPTERQLQVLESLRQMRQGLMAKQREIESVVTPDVMLPDPYQ